MITSKEKYAVIMAGGQGRRLWPASNDKKPKQFIKFGSLSLLERTFKRLLPMFEVENILVITGKGYGEIVEKQLNSLPEENIIEEPYQRNTAACIGLAGIISKYKWNIEPANSVMTVLPADHLVRKESQFRKTLDLGYKVASEGKFYVTLGIDPTYPATGYGYIKAGDKIDSFQANEVLDFTEKPNLKRAKSFLKEGNYYWNSGTFIWRTDLLFEGIKRYMPDLMEALDRIAKYIGKEDEKVVLEKEYQKIPSLSIDYGLMEKAPDRAVIPSSFGWSDVGDWSSVGRIIGEDESGNSVEGQPMLRDVSNSVIYDKGPNETVCLGLEDVVVVNTEEAVLVMHKSKAQELKKIVREIENEGGGNET